MRVVPTKALLQSSTTTSYSGLQNLCITQVSKINLQWLHNFKGSTITTVWSHVLHWPTNCIRVQNTQCFVLLAMQLRETLYMLPLRRWHPSTCPYPTLSFLLEPISKAHCSLLSSLHVPPGEKTVWGMMLNFLGLFPRGGKDQWDCKIGNYFVALPLQQ